MNIIQVSSAFCTSISYPKKTNDENIPGQFLFNAHHFALFSCFSVFIVENRTIRVCRYVLDKNLLLSTGGGKKEWKAFDANSYSSLREKTSTHFLFYKQ